MTPISRSLALIFSVLALACASNARADQALSLSYPDNCPSRAQDCMDQICAAGGGTLVFAPGEIADLGDVVFDSPFGALVFKNFLIVSCSNVTIAGAGIDVTILKANYSCPVNGSGPPMVALGNAPGSPPPGGLDNVVVRDFTVKCDLGPTCAQGGTSTCAFAPFAVAWSGGESGTTLRDLKIDGFQEGINIQGSANVTIKDNVIVGRGSGVPFQNDRAIHANPNAFLGFPISDPAIYPFRDLVIQNNFITNSTFGIFLNTTANSEITENTITDGRVGIRIVGGDDFAIKGNIIERMSSAFSPTQSNAPIGINVRSTDHSVIKDNLICDSIGGNAIVLGPSGPTTFEILRNPGSFDPGNGDDIIKGNQFLGYDPDTCGGVNSPGAGQNGYCFLAGAPGTIADEGGNDIRDNVANPSGTCRK